MKKMEDIHPFWVRLLGCMFVSLALLASMVFPVYFLSSVAPEVGLWDLGVARILAWISVVAGFLCLIYWIQGLIAVWEEGFLRVVEAVADISGALIAMSIPVLHLLGYFYGMLPGLCWAGLFFFVGLGFLLTLRRIRKRR